MDVGEMAEKTHFWVVNLHRKEKGIIMFKRHPIIPKNSLRRCPDDSFYRVIIEFATCGLDNSPRASLCSAARQNPHQLSKPLPLPKILITVRVFAFRCAMLQTVAQPKREREPFRTKEYTQTKAPTSTTNSHPCVSLMSRKGRNDAARAKVARRKRDENHRRRSNKKRPSRFLLTTNNTIPSNQAIKRSRPHRRLQSSLSTGRPTLISMLPPKIRLLQTPISGQTLHLYHPARAPIIASDRHRSAAALSTRTARESIALLSAMTITIMRHLHRSRIFYPWAPILDTTTIKMTSTSQHRPKYTACQRLRPRVLISR